MNAKIDSLLPFRLPRWGWRLLSTLAGVLLLYALLGFLVLPAVLKAKLPVTLERTLGRPVRVRQVRLNPFTLTLTVDGFAVQERGHGDFMGWERLRVSLDPATLYSHSLAFRGIELERPFGQVIIESDGRLNYADIVARLGGPAPTSPDPTPARILRIGHLAVHGARVNFLDRSLKQPFATTLGPLSLELTGFSSALNRSSLYAFAGRTEAGERFDWTGSFSVEPLASRGRFSIERLLLPKYQPFFQDQVAFRTLEGLASAQAAYTFQWSEGHHVMRLQDGSLDLLGLKLAQGPDHPELVLPRIAARGMEADLITRSLQVRSLGLDDGRIALTRARDGQIDLVRMLTPKTPASPEPAAPWKLTLAELRLQGFQVAFRDLQPVRPVQALATDLALRLQGLSLDPAAQARLQLSLRLNGANLSAQGTVTPLEPAVDLDLRLDRLGLPPFDPYLAPATDIRLNRGSLSLDGHLSGRFRGLPSDPLAFRGNLRLDGFEAADGLRREPFLGYRRLSLAGLELHRHPDRLSIQSVDLLEPSPRLVLAADGSTNVSRALKLDAPPAPGAKPLAVAGAALPAGPDQPLRLTIRRTHMAGGRLSFIDRSVQPNAALLITGLEGNATSLSTEPDSQSVVDFKGLAGGLAPLRIQGRAMPLRKDQDTDVSVTIEASELTDFSPYAGKFLGYTIHKGKLSVDAHVRIQQRQLEALLKTRMDQFYLGDKVASPDATKLPVKLCLAILRDRKGVIDLELPVSGSLDDPDMHYGKIVLHALVNVMTKVVTSPFTLLAKLGGGGDHDLSYVTFPAGSAVPDPVAQAKTQTLARALAERPELNLEAEGCTDAADTGALKQRHLERALARLKAGDAAGPGAPELAPAEREKWLRVAYQRAFPSASGAAPAPPVAEMEQRLLGTYTVSGDELHQLGAARSKALFALLLEAKVEPGRLFAVTGGERAAKEGGSRVYFGLK